MSATAAPSSTSKDGPCGDKNCPRHGSIGTMASRASQMIKEKGSSEGNNPSSKRDAKGNSSKLNESVAKVTENLADMDHGLDELIQRTRHLLRVSVPASKTGANNNVVTIINNNHIQSFKPEKSDGSKEPSPNVSGATTLSTSSTGVFMRLEHVMKENATLQSITMMQTEEITTLKNQLKEIQTKLEADQEEKLKLKTKLKSLTKMTLEWNDVIQDYERTIETLQSRLRYTDLKAKQLKRIASENASTASKWRIKALESLQAQKELEERKTASEKAAIGLYQQFREEKKRNVDFKRRIGESITEGDLDSTTSTTIGPLDTTMIATPSPKKALKKATKKKTVHFIRYQNM